MEESKAFTKVLFSDEVREVRIELKLDLKRYQDPASAFAIIEKYVQKKLKATSIEFSHHLDVSNPVRAFKDGFEIHDDRVCGRIMNVVLHSDEEGNVDHLVFTIKPAGPYQDVLVSLHKSTQLTVAAVWYTLPNSAGVPGSEGSIIGKFVIMDLANCKDVRVNHEAVVG